MKTMIMLLACTMVFSLGIGTAYAGNGDGQLGPAPLGSNQVQPRPVLGSTLRSRPLFTIGGIEVHVRAPVTPPYNTEANDDRAGWNLWGTG